MKPILFKKNPGSTELLNEFLSLRVFYTPLNSPNTPSTSF